MNIRYIRKNLVSVSVIIYVILYGLIVYTKPAFLYNSDGSLRQFGLNNSKKTVFPAWLLALILAIISYLFVLYYITLPKLLY